MRQAGFVMVCVLAAMVWRPGEARAQIEARVLMLDDDAAFSHNYWFGVRQALGRFIDRDTRSFVSFMKYITEEEFDHVVVVYYRLRSPEEHRALAEALEAHLARGGTLAITYPHLDAAPELWEVLGVASAEDPPVPEVISPTLPLHPSWLGVVGGLGIFAPPLWADFGDVLSPGPDGVVIGEYSGSGLPVMLATLGGQVLVNGLNWDDWGQASFVGRAQTRSLLSCLADFDGNGVLDFFDFLAFQDAFAAGDLRADFDLSGRLTFFDFLAFQDAFAHGCWDLR